MERRTVVEVLLKVLCDRFAKGLAKEVDTGGLAEFSHGR